MCERDRQTQTERQKERLWKQPLNLWVHWLKVVVWKHHEARSWASVSDCPAHLSWPKEELQTSPMLRKSKQLFIFHSSEFGRYEWPCSCLTVRASALAPGYHSIWATTQEKGSDCVYVCGEEKKNVGTVWELVMLAVERKKRAKIRRERKSKELVSIFLESANFGMIFN